MTSSPWKVITASPVRRAIDRLAPKVAMAVLDFLTGPSCENPHRVGRPLRGDLEGLHSARVGAYRVIYEIDETSRMGTVLYMDHRADVYQPR